MQQNNRPAIDEQYLSAAGVDPETEVRDHIRASRTAERQEREFDWRVNWGFQNNRPWEVRSRQTGRVMTIPPERRSELVMHNIITPRIETLVGVEAYAPRFFGRPTAQRGTEDQIRARATGDVANHVARVVDLPAKKTRADNVKHGYGLAYFHLYHDPAAGPREPVLGVVPCPQCSGDASVVGADGQPAPCPTCTSQGVVMDTNGRPAGRGQVVEPTGDTRPTGDLALDVCPPWECLPDPMDDPFNPTAFVRQRPMQRAVAAARFLPGTGLTEEDLEPATGSDMRGIPWGTNLGFEALPSTFTEMVMVLEFWRRFPPEHPCTGGLYVCMVGSKVIRAGRFPINIPAIPFVPYRCYEREGFYYPESTCDRLIPLQFDHNELNRLAFEHARMAVTMRVMKPKGIAFDLTDEPGVTDYEFKPGFPKPEFLRDPGMPQDVFQTMERIVKMADEVSYAVDAMRGMSAGSQDTATFADVRQERAMMPLRRMIIDNERSLALLGRMFVDAAKVVYTDGRMFRDVFGSTGKSALRSMRLDQVGDSDDCELLPEKDLGRTNAARRQEVLELAKSGAYNDPRVLKMLGLGNQDAAEDEYRADEALADEQDYAVRTWDPSASPPPALSVMPYENDDVHMARHGGTLNELRSSLGDSHPRVQLMAQHWSAHHQMKLMKQGIQTQMQDTAASAHGLANAADPNAQPDAQAAAVTPPDPGPAQTPPVPQPGGQ